MNGEIGLGSVLLLRQVSRLKMLHELGRDSLEKITDV